MMNRSRFTPAIGTSGLIEISLPKTRSGKLLRRSIRQICNDEEVPIPPTIEEPRALEAVQAAWQEAKK